MSVLDRILRAVNAGFAQQTADDEALSQEIQASNAALSASIQATGFALAQAIAANGAKLDAILTILTETDSTISGAVITLSKGT